MTIDTANPGTAFDPGVRGQAVPAVNITRPQTWVGGPKARAVATGSSIRGVAGGLETDVFTGRPATTTRDGRRLNI